MWRSFCFVKCGQLIMSQILLIIIEAFTPVTVLSAVASPVVVTLRVRVVSVGSVMPRRPESSKLSPATVDVKEREYSG